MHKKKLIEVALPLEKINEEASLRKRKAPAGYPTTLHRWWAQRPLAAARAVIFAQMVDDPSSHPELFPTLEGQDAERQRLFRLIEQLVLWENTTNDSVLQQARDEIWKSWRLTCDMNVSHPRATELFNPKQLPGFHDPFAGSGALPLEAQRLGLESYVSDLNPVAVLLNKALIEILPKFVGQPPVNPQIRQVHMATDQQWRGAKGLAEDLRYYGKWMRDEAESRIGHLYPKITVTSELAQGRPDLSPYVDQELTVIAWLWARTVKSPNPAFRHVDVPLASTFMLSTKPGKEAYIEPVIDTDSYHFHVRVGKPEDAKAVKNGTKLARGANFRCLLSGTPIQADYIKAEGRAGRMGVRLMSIVAEGSHGRIYITPTPEHEAIARQAQPEWVPETPLAPDPRALWTPLYGLKTFGDLFTSRQLVALNTFSDLVQEVRARVLHDALIAGLSDDPRGFSAGGVGAVAYADAIAVYAAFAIDRLADYGSSLATWRSKDNAMRATLSLQALPMTWDYAEGSPFGVSSSGFTECIAVIARVIATAWVTSQGHVSQANATTDMTPPVIAPVISTDPPYYDNVGYADLSDFFYVWLRRTLRVIFPDIFTTLAVPKAEELVATPYRHGSKEQAESFFLSGMTHTMQRLAAQAHPSFPITIYYAFKQSETDDDNGTASTGWETFLGAVIQAGFAITGTWPMRTEGDNRRVGIGTNALASSIILVCRPRSEDAPIVTRRDFLSALKDELPDALAHLQRGNIAPVDLAQAAIGPGMAVFTRYSKVLDSGGKTLTVRAALALINQVLDEVLAEQEGDFDADTRWALAWFEQFGFLEGEYGMAETLAVARNTSIRGMAEAGLVISKGGKVRLLQPDELPPDWDPTTDPRLSVWEIVHHLVRALNKGELSAAALVSKLGAHADIARELAYRLYVICERKKRAMEALAYNALVQSWPEMLRLASEQRTETMAQSTLLGEG